MKRTLSQAGRSDFENKRTLVRVDFNVPLNKDGSISDDTRIRSTLPTIRLLCSYGARVILVSHLGRPDGVTPGLSLKVAAQRLSELINQPVQFAADCIGASASDTVASLAPGSVCMLENVRFHKEEERNDPEFAKQLAALADVYVNDAFGTAHRAHASTEGVTRFLRPTFAGLLMAAEIEALSTVLENPSRPFLTIIGGAKVSSKIKVLENLIKKIDALVIGGAMAFTFLKARGFEIGKSLCEIDRVEFCKELEAAALSKGVKLILPVDIVVATEIKEGTEIEIVDTDKIPQDKMGLDVGPRTSELINAEIVKSKTILWNGPLGVFEVKGFDVSTRKLVEALAAATAAGTRTVVGGGDSVAAIDACNKSPDAFSFVSTGGGASLEFLEGVELPGIACLDDADAPTAASTAATAGGST